MIPHFTSAQFKIGCLIPGIHQALQDFNEIRETLRNVPDYEVVIGLAPYME